MNSAELLLDQTELQDAIETGELAEWKKKRYIEFRDTMRNTRYPCYFAVNAEYDDTARYLFPGDVRDRETLLEVREGLRQYLQQYQSIAKRTTLVVFFEPGTEGQGEREYRKQFWRVLKFLHERDPEPWPSDIPTEPDDPEWEFCFAGEPMFIVGRAPFYTERKSRYTPYGLEITIQPRKTLDDIRGDTVKGQRVRSIIADRLESYDDIAPHHHIGDYGDPTSREWRQYLLPTSNEERLEEFPFEINA
jgi:uncharacterized protein